MNEGDKVKIVFTNKLDEATTVHWHGIDVPSDADGVPGLTQDPIKPGQTFTYEFAAKPAGTHFYHTHGSGTHGQEAGQMDAGLAGAIIIHPKDEVKADIDVPLILGGGSGGNYTLNGAVFPHTKGITVKTGQLVRLRMINAGSAAIHPMHVHGHQVTVDAIDGNPVPKAMRMLRNTVTVNPGETVDLLVRAYNPGKWVIHCHDLNHVSGGMAMPFIYSDYKKGATPGTPTVTSLLSTTSPPHDEGPAAVPAPPPWSVAILSCCSSRPTCQATSLGVGEHRVAFDDAVTAAHHHEHGRLLRRDTHDVRRSRVDRDDPADTDLERLVAAEAHVDLALVDEDHLLLLRVQVQARAALGLHHLHVHAERRDVELRAHATEHAVAERVDGRCDRPAVAELDGGSVSRRHVESICAPRNAANADGADPKADPVATRSVSSARARAPARVSTGPLVRGRGDTSRAPTARPACGTRPTRGA